MTNDLQPSLFDDRLAPIVEPEPLPDGKTASIEDRFAAFHAANPHVYSALRRLALQMRRAGHKRWSTKGAFEVLRWQYAMLTESADGFKLNNIYTRPYAHLLMERETELTGFFETRNHHNGKGSDETQDDH